MEVLLKTDRPADAQRVMLMDVAGSDTHGRSPQKLSTLFLSGAG